MPPLPCSCVQVRHVAGCPAGAQELRAELACASISVNSALHKQVLFPIGRRAQPFPRWQLTAQLPVRSLAPTRDSYPAADVQQCIGGGNDTTSGWVQGCVKRRRRRQPADAALPSAAPFRCSPALPPAGCPCQLRVRARFLRAAAALHTDSRRGALVAHPAAAGIHSPWRHTWPARLGGRRGGGRLPHVSFGTGAAG